MKEDEIHNLFEFNEEDQQLTEKQEKIIHAAIEMFSKKGYAATSTKEIAKRAGVAEGTIFRHYSTKKDLLISIVSPMMKKLLAPFIIRDIAKVLDIQYDSYEEFLYAMLKNRVSFLKKNLPIVKIMLQEIPFQPEIKALFKEHIGKEVYKKVEQLVQHFQENGDIIEMPTESAIRLMAATGLGTLMIQYMMLPEIDWNEEKELERTVQFIMYGLAQR